MCQFDLQSTSLTDRMIVQYEDFWVNPLAVSLLAMVKSLARSTKSFPLFLFEA